MKKNKLQALALFMVLAVLCSGVGNGIAFADINSDPNAGIVDVSLGDWHSAIIKEDGSAWLWGANYNGQIGNATFGGLVDTPYRYNDGNSNATKVSAFDLGTSSSAMVNTDHTLWTFGYNGECQLGTGGSNVDINRPFKIMDNVKDVSFGMDVSAALKEDGSLWMFGSNYGGKIGVGTEDSSLAYEPTKVLDDVISVSVGSLHTGAIKNDGSLWMWGMNSAGQIGDGETTNVSSPKKIMDDVISVSAGGGASAAIKRDHSLWMWGNGFDIIPKKIMDDVIDVCVGLGFYAVIKADHSLWMWGNNNCGQVGDGTTANVSAPKKILDDVSKVALGETHSAAVKNDGTLWMWGNNDHSQIGNGVTDQTVLSPRQILPTKTTPSEDPTASTPADPTTFPSTSPEVSPTKVPSSHPSFVDVKKGDYFYNSVNWAVQQGVTSGTSNTTFSPNMTCTRAHVMTFLWRAYGSTESFTGANRFNDVKTSDYYYKPVIWAVENGITAGTSNTTFGSNNPCTRGQVMTFLWRAAGSPEVTSANPFKDVKSSDYYYKAVLWAVKKGVTAGTSANTFSPLAACTRAQVVTFLYKNAGNELAPIPIQENGVPDGTYQTVLEGIKQGAPTSMYKIEVVNNCVVIYGSFVRYDDPSQLNDLDYLPTDLNNGRYAFPINGNTAFFYNERNVDRTRTGDKAYSSVNEFAKEVQTITNESAKVSLIIIVKNGVAQRMTLYL